MEGCYNKIFLARDKAPASSYNYFLGILVDTIRDEIAACMEKSFDKIQLNEAAKMLSISSTNSMKEYAKKVFFTWYYFIHSEIVINFSCRETGCWNQAIFMPSKLTWKKLMMHLLQWTLQNKLWNMPASWRWLFEISLHFFFFSLYFIRKFHHIQLFCKLLQKWIWVVIFNFVSNLFLSIFVIDWSRYSPSRRLLRRLAACWWDLQNTNNRNGRTFFNTDNQLQWLLMYKLPTRRSWMFVPHSKMSGSTKKCVVSHYLFRDLPSCFALVAPSNSFHSLRLLNLS